MCPPSEGDTDEESPRTDLDQADEPAEPEASDGVELVVVIDTSTIIQVKRTVSVDEQWPIFAQMLNLVRQGRLVFPIQVKRELSGEKYPDMPGPWCAEAARVRQHPDPVDETLAEILPFVEQLVDPNADPKREPADPYVAAQAWELLESGYDVAVATDDVIDRLPLKIALATACAGLGIPVWGCETFVEWVRATRDEVD